MQRGLGALAAVLTWLAWLAISPVLGFPILSPAAMVNRMLSARIPEAGHNPGLWVGWVIVIAGLLAAVAAFFVVERTHVIRNDIGRGVIFGAALWLFAGVAIMPLIGLVEPTVPVPARLDSMHATLMMSNLGPLAALGALIAWVLFGAVLGATGRKPA